MRSFTPGDSRSESAAASLRCSVCGEAPGWSLPREGDPCWNEDGGYLVRSESSAAWTQDQVENLLAERDGLRAELDKAWALLRLVSQARHEGWYEDDPSWKPIDDALGLGDE